MSFTDPGAALQVSVPPYEKMATRLPSPADERLLHLVSLSKECRAIHDLHQPDYHRLRDLRSTIKNQIAEMLASGPVKVFLHKNKGKEPHEIQAKRAELAQVEKDFERIRTRTETEGQKAERIRRTLTAARYYLEQTPRGEIKAVGPVKLAKNTTIDKLAAKVADLKADRDQIEFLPWPAADCKERLTAELNFIASFGRIDVANSVAARNQITWPNRTVRVVGFGKAYGTRADPYDMNDISPEMAMFVWLHKDQLKARLFDEIDAIADDNRALSLADRTARIEALSAEILQAEREISELIWATNDHTRWPEIIDPRAVLGVDGPPVRED